MGEVIYFTSKTSGRRSRQRTTSAVQSPTIPPEAGGEQWQRLIDRGCRLAQDRFSSPCRYQTSVQWQNESTDIWQRLFFNRSAKQVIIDKDIFFPIYSDQHFFGAFQVAKAILLPETQLSQLFDLFSLIIDNGLKALIQNGSLIALESRLAPLSNDSNANDETSKVITLTTAHRSSPWFLGPMSFTSSPPPIFGHVIIECSDLHKAKQFAIDINSSTIGNGMVSLTDFENNFFTADELNNLSDMALFIPDLSQLSPAQIHELQKYLDRRHEPHSLNLIIATPLPLETLVEQEKCPVNLLYSRHVQKIVLAADQSSQAPLRNLLDSFWRLEFLVNQQG